MIPLEKVDGADSVEKIEGQELGFQSETEFGAVVGDESEAPVSLVRSEVDGVVNGHLRMFGFKFEEMVADVF